MKINQYIKWVNKIIKGKGNKYYPKDLIPHLTHTVKDCENCKNVLAENLAIKVNIKLNGGQYRKQASRY